MGYRDETTFTDFVVDQMQAIGPVRSRRMFGGYGLFLGDLMVGLIARHTLYLKVDDQSRPRFEAMGLEAFGIERHGRRIVMSFSQAPEEVFEDSEVMADWGNEAYAAACRAARSK